MGQKGPKGSDSYLNGYSAGYTAGRHDALQGLC